jgi:DNA-binding response OmpR family regulator
MDQLRVLLVDDEVEFVTTLAERLEIRDIPTLVAADGEQALQIMERDQPPVVVLDVMMPGLGGLDVLQLIKRKYPGTQIILLTGHGSTKDGIKGMRMGAFDYIMKPVQIEDLINKMNEAYKALHEDKS